MAANVETKPVEDSVAKINDELAVGSDLEFQRRWWRLERIVWILFGLFVLLDVLGCFGRGPVANAHQKTSDGAMSVKYERIERFSSPSILTVNFGQPAIHDEKVQLWVSDTLVKALGNQRVVPQPETSVLGQGGILYTFAATQTQASVEFALEPSGPGIYNLRMQVPNTEALNLKIYVVP